MQVRILSFKVLTDSLPVKILEEEKGQPCIVFLKNVYFSKEKRQQPIGNLLILQLQFRSLNLEMTY